MVGGCAETMQLSLFNGTQVIAHLDQDDARISNYKIIKGTCLHIDDNPDKFYDKKLNALKVQERCLVSINGTAHPGTIQYIGGFQLKAGIHVGVEFDEPIGNNDGR